MILTSRRTRLFFKFWIQGIWRYYFIPYHSNSSIVVIKVIVQVSSPTTIGLSADMHASHFVGCYYHFWAKYFYQALIKKKYLGKVAESFGITNLFQISMKTNF